MEKLAEIIVKMTEKVWAKPQVWIDEEGNLLSEELLNAAMEELGCSDDEVCNGMDKYGKQLVFVFKQLESEAREDILDSRMLAENPMKFYGLSQSMFK